MKIDICKSNFTDKSYFKSFCEQFNYELLKHRYLFSVYDEDKRLRDPYSQYGYTRLMLLLKFVSDPGLRGLITISIGERIIKDMNSIHRIRNRTKTYYKFDYSKGCTHIKYPMVPFQFVTLVCKLPKANWYGNSTKRGVIVPSRLRTVVQTWLKESGLSYSGRGEYYLHQEMDSEICRSILHFHIFIPLLKLNTTLSNDQLTETASSCDRLLSQYKLSVDNNHRVEYAKAFIDKIKDSVEINGLINEDELKTIWSDMCRKNYIPIECNIAANIKFGERHSFMPPDIEQTKVDVMKVRSYIEKQGFFPRKFNGTCRWLEYDKGKDQVSVSQTHDCIDHPIPSSASLKDLFNLYRNNCSARPSRFRGGFCLESHPLYELLAKRMPFEIGKELYLQKWQDTYGFDAVFNY